MTSITTIQESTMESTITEVDQPAAKAARKAKTAKEPNAAKVRILKVDRCPSLTGRSELTYHIGCIGDAIQIRVYQNTGKGYFNQEWVAYGAIEDLLAQQEEFSAGTLRSIFVGKSVNTAGFFLAVLKHLGLIATSKQNQRLYTHTESAAFETAVKDLIASDESIEIEEPQKVRAARKGKPDVSSPDASPDTPTAPSSKKGTLKLKKP